MSDFTKPVGNYESRVVQDLDAPLGPDDLSHDNAVQVQLSHAGGRLYSFDVHGRFLDDKPVVEIWLQGGEELFLHPDALASIVKAISLSTMPVVHWCGSVEDNVEGYGDD